MALSGSSPQTGDVRRPRLSAHPQAFAPLRSAGQQTLLSDREDRSVDRFPTGAMTDHGERITDKSRSRHGPSTSDGVGDNPCQAVSSVWFLARSGESEADAPQGVFLGGGPWPAPGTFTLVSG